MAISPYVYRLVLAERMLDLRQPGSLRCRITAGHGGYQVV
jgi:hypothetical protein